MGALAEKQKALEDEALIEIAGWSQSKRLVYYALLHRGYQCTMTNIDFTIIKAIKDEHSLEGKQ